MRRRDTVMRTVLLAGFLPAVLWAIAVRPAAAAGPCAADEQKFCSELQPGGGRIVRCLHAHANELSDACKSHIREKRQEMAEAWKVCKPDVEKLCAGVQRGGGRILACLKAHESAVSAACKDELAKVRQGE
jgi:hypothetical protein